MNDDEIFDDYFQDEDNYYDKYDAYYEDRGPFDESYDDLIDGVGFADPGGNSALRAETESNPRIYPCPSCKEPNVLTRIDVARHYQCDSCADRAEGKGY